MIWSGAGSLLTARPPRASKWRTLDRRPASFQTFAAAKLARLAEAGGEHRDQRRRSFRIRLEHLHQVAAADFEHARAAFGDDRRVSRSSVQHRDLADELARLDRNLPAAALD